ncbi:hypothetical protein V6N11_056707 [Hibiscus sabdariffa]|uniref:Uncharacterized protein n=1 Tax=Hibiscus sabdariffa TaxID=183260 RepID=A0ABR2T4N4_9ROSI
MSGVWIWGFGGRWVRLGEGGQWGSLNGAPRVGTWFGGGHVAGRSSSLVLLCRPCSWEVRGVQRGLLVLTECRQG